MSNRIFALAGVTEEQYRDWCKDNKKASYKKEVKREFFAKIQNGKIVKDSSGKLVKKEN